MIATPPYIDSEAWAGFVEMRIKIKKPMTLRAARMVLTELQKLKDAGHDANAALDQSTNHCWCDVYEPKDRPISRKASTEADKTSAYLESLKPEQQDAARRAEVADMLRRTAATLRRVA